MCPQHTACQPCSYKKRRQPIAETYQFHIVSIEKSENQQQSDSVIQDRITQIIFRSHRLHMGKQDSLHDNSHQCQYHRDAKQHCRKLRPVDPVQFPAGLQRIPIWRTASCAATRGVIPSRW